MLLLLFARISLYTINTYNNNDMIRAVTGILDLSARVRGTFQLFVTEPPTRSTQIGRGSHGARALCAFQREKLCAIRNKKQKTTTTKKNIKN